MDVGCGPTGLNDIENRRAIGHRTYGNGVRGPAARVTLRGWLRGRALRPPAPGAVHRQQAQVPAGEAAFAALVGRHGPMVLGVCRQFLGDAQHAEDAFQAVFLVLAQKARAIRDPDLLGNWLYGVAIRTARSPSTSSPAVASGRRATP